MARGKKVIPSRKLYYKSRLNRQELLPSRGQTILCDPIKEGW